MITYLHFLFLLVLGVGECASDEQSLERGNLWTSTLRSRK